MRSFQFVYTFPTFGRRMFQLDFGKGINVNRISVFFGKIFLSYTNLRLVDITHLSMLFYALFTACVLLLENLTFVTSVKIYFDLRFSTFLCIVCVAQIFRQFNAIVVVVGSLDANVTRILCFFLLFLFLPLFRLSNPLLVTLVHSNIQTALNCFLLTSNCQNYSLELFFFLLL